MCLCMHVSAELARKGIDEKGRSVLSGADMLATIRRRRRPSYCRCADAAAAPDDGDKVYDVDGNDDGDDEDEDDG